MHSLIFAALLQIAQTPVRPPVWQDDLEPAGNFTVHADPECPVNSVESSSVIAEVLQRYSISADNPSFRLDVAISCYQTRELSRQSYAVMLQIENVKDQPVSFRRMGVLPGLATGDRDFILKRLDRMLNQVLSEQLNQPATDQ